MVLIIAEAGINHNGDLNLAKKLNSAGVEIISTGGTSESLMKSNIPVTELNNFTGFPEILDGRVKTLHPKIHAGILHDRQKKNHRYEMSKQKFPPLDLIVVNFYPFQKNPW